MTDPVTEPATEVPALRVEDAVLALAGPPSRFRSADIGVGHGAAARVRVNVALTGDVQRRLHRLLADYRPELDALGIDYDALALPDQSGTAPAPKQSKPIGRTRVWVDERGLWMTPPYSALDLVRTQIPAAVWQKARSAWLLPATPAAALSIASALGAYGIDADDAATALVNAAHEAVAAQVHRHRDDLPPVPGSKTDAWMHQRQAFWFAREMPGVILDCEMGTGKSKMVVDLLTDAHLTRDEARAVLIVCPERVVGVWGKQVALHSSVDWHVIDPRKQNRRGEWNLVPVKDRVALYDHALHECDCGRPHILVSNYAAAAFEPFKSWSLRQSWDFVVYDECHRIRSHSGVWSKWAAKMRPRTRRVIGGTGTLQAQTPMDVFGVARAVEPATFGSTFTAFQRRYAIMGGFEGREFRGMNPDTEPEFVRKLASICYRAGEEVLDLPEMLPEVTVTGHLSPRAAKVYHDLEEELYAAVVREAEDGTVFTDEVAVDNVLVKILRCQQITGGALPLDSGDVEEIDTAKFDLLVDELEDIASHEPVVVFARFHHDLRKIEEAAARTGRVYGELSGKRADALAVDATLADGVTLAGIQLQAGGTGVDFTKSAYGIYYSVGYSLADFLQSRKRLQRPGQTRPVRFRHLVLEGTIDEVVYEALQARQSVTERIAAKVLGVQQKALA